jgi:hypothetical protein
VRNKSAVPTRASSARTAWLTADGETPISRAAWRKLFSLAVARKASTPSRTLTGLKMVPDAGHDVFLSPCSQELARSEPDLCADPAGTDRTADYRKIDADALKFFRNVLVSSSRSLTILVNR